MVFFKYHIIIFVLLIKLLFNKPIEENLNFYEDKVIYLNKNYSFNISSNKVQNFTPIKIIIDFNSSVFMSNGNIQLVYNYKLGKEEKIEKKIFSYSENKKVAYLTFTIKPMKIINPI